MDINNMNSVFDTAVEEEKAFDTIFGAEEDDELMSIVLGEEAETDEEFYAMLGEEGDLPDMNTLDDGSSVKELEKDVVGGEIDAPKCEPSENVETPDKTDSEKDKPGEDIACPQAGVADAVENKEPDEEKLEDEIDKAENKVDLEESFIAAILGEEAFEEETKEEPKIDYDTAPAKDTKEEDVKTEGEGCEECEDGECKDKSEITPDDTPVVYDGDGEAPADPADAEVPGDGGDDEDDDEDLDVVFADDDDDDDEAPAPEDENCGKKENAEAIEDDQTPQIQNNTEENDESQLDGEPGLDGEQGLKGDVGLESADLDDIFAETAEDTTEEEEKVEDEIIKAAEDEAEMSDAEVAALTGEEEDDELLNAIMGE